MRSAVLVALSLTLAECGCIAELVPAGAQRATRAGKSLLILWLLSGAAILVATATLVFVLRPISSFRGIFGGLLRAIWRIGRSGTAWERVRTASA
jgi:hypothetical protein